MNEREKRERRIFRRLVRFLKDNDNDNDFDSEKTKRFEEETGISINMIYDILYDYVYDDFDEYAYNWMNGYEDTIDFSGSWDDLKSYERDNLINGVTEGYYLYKKENKYKEINDIENIKNFKEFVEYAYCLHLLDNNDIEKVVGKNYNRIAERFNYDDEDEEDED